MLQKELLAIQTIIYLNKVLSAGYNPCNGVEYNCSSGVAHHQLAKVFSVPFVKESNLYNRMMC